jgi:hypothetical protein
MIYIIIAQVARGAVIWTTNRVAKKVLRTVAVGAITMYLTKRYKILKEREDRRKF